jgi:hypothetical protein
VVAIMYICTTGMVFQEPDASPLPRDHVIKNNDVIQTKMFTHLGKTRSLRMKNHDSPSSHSHSVSTCLVPYHIIRATRTISGVIRLVVS